MKNPLNAPWVIVRSSDFTENPEDTAIQSVVDCNGQTVIFTDSGYFRPNEDYVRAIVTLPEILEAVENLFEHCAMVHKHWGDGSNQKEADEAIKAARAAIAKVKGV